jgi:urease accessory protein
MIGFFRRFFQYAMTISILFPVAAIAHHPLGGEMPTTFLDGFLSGIGHTLIEPAHLLFLLGFAVLMGVSQISPSKAAAFIISFLSAVSLGTLLAFNLSLIFFPPIFLAVCLLVLGSLLWLRAIPRIMGLLFILATGFCHGVAFSETVLGAESTPILAYISGLVVIQSALLFFLFLLIRYLAISHGDVMKLFSRFLAAALTTSGAIMALAF